MTGSSFLFFNIILEALMWASHRREQVRVDPEKDRAVAATAGTPAVAVAPQGGVAPTAV